jgi:serine/threonine protein phosphatase 1
MGRTFAVGDVHGDLAALKALLKKLPLLGADDTLVFVGDYLDRGPKSLEVVRHLRSLSSRTEARIVTLRGNHEDAWLRVIDEGWIEFLIPRPNGAFETFRSFARLPPPTLDDTPSAHELRAMQRGAFFPPDVVEWMRSLPYFYEDEHAIYVHAGLPPNPDGTFPHPSEVEPPSKLLWLRSRAFFEGYRGKLVVFGHTTTNLLPPDLSTYTPDDPTDFWAGPACVGLDTGAGKGGFLTAIELPARLVYESRPAKA